MFWDDKEQENKTEKTNLSREYDILFCLLLFFLLKTEKNVSYFDYCCPQLREGGLFHALTQRFIFLSQPYASPLEFQNSITFASHVRDVFFPLLLLACSRSYSLSHSHSHSHSLIIVISLFHSLYVS